MQCATQVKLNIDAAAGLMKNYFITKNRIMKRSLITHVAAAIIVTGVMMAMYATVQQAHRTAANDPQLQLARDISARLTGNKMISSLLPGDTIDLANSLGTFVTLYDAKGDAMQSTGLLDGKMPQIPAGVFDYAKANKEDVLTWQPRNDVRMAMVVEAVASPQVGYVAVGRSLQEVEERESNLTMMILITWLACMGVLVVHFALQSWIARKSAK